MTRRTPATAERDGNLHIHKSQEYVSGTYHDSWHTITRVHQGVTPVGHKLHEAHINEVREERKDKERAVMAMYSATCTRCGNRILMASPAWWKPSTKALRHRGDGVCDKSSDEEYDPIKEPPSSTSSADFRRLEENLRTVVAKFEQDKAEMRERIVAVEKEALAATERLKKVDARKVIEVVTPARVKPVKVGVQHREFPKLLRLANARINVAMVGDAGSGKTTAPRGVAKALGLPFYHCPVGPQTSKSDLLGFISGAGKYVYSLLCQAYETGGVALLDEMDAANPATLTIANGMIDAVEAGFADKMRKRHPDCIFMAAMNTFGRGADMLFVGRAQLDAATLNRWYYLNWDTDWDLTRALVNDDKWVNYVEALYNSMNRPSARVRATIGMRTAIMGKKAMLAGDTREEAEHGVIWAPLKPDDKQKILAGVVKRESA